MQREREANIFEYHGIQCVKTNLKKTSGVLNSQSYHFEACMSQFYFKIFHRHYVIFQI